MRPATARAATLLALALVCPPPAAATNPELNSRAELEEAVNSQDGCGAAPAPPCPYDPIDGWDLSLVTSMGEVFDGHSTFNADLDGWNVGQVTDMARAQTPLPLPSFAPLA